MENSDSPGSATELEYLTRVGPILRLARLKENKQFLSTKVRRHLQLFDSGPILGMLLPYSSTSWIGIPCSPKINLKNLNYNCSLIWLNEWEQDSGKGLLFFTLPFIEIGFRFFPSIEVWSAPCNSTGGLAAAAEQVAAGF